MTATCLLCPSPAMADSLCVPCGAKKWAAQITALLGAATKMPPEWLEERAKALRGLTPAAARDFLAILAKKQAKREALLCPRGCVSHEGE